MFFSISCPKDTKMLINHTISTPYAHPYPDSANFRSPIQQRTQYAHGAPAISTAYPIC